MEHLRNHEAYPSDLGNKKPARTMYVLAGSIRYISYTFGSSDKPYANRP